MCEKFQSNFRCYLGIFRWLDMVKPSEFVRLLCIDGPVCRSVFRPNNRVA